MVEFKQTGDLVMFAVQGKEMFSKFKVEASIQFNVGTRWSGAIPPAIPFTLANGIPSCRA